MNSWSNSCVFTKAWWLIFTSCIQYTCTIIRQSDFITCVKNSRTVMNYCKTMHFIGGFSSISFIFWIPKSSLQVKFHQQSPSERMFWPPNTKSISHVSECVCLFSKGTKPHLTYAHLVAVCDSTVITPQTNTSNKHIAHPHLIITKSTIASYKN